MKAYSLLTICLPKPLMPYISCRSAFSTALHVKSGPKWPRSIPVSNPGFAGQSATLSSRPMLKRDVVAIGDWKKLEKRTKMGKNALEKWTDYLIIGTSSILQTLSIHCRQSFPGFSKSISRREWISSSVAGPTGRIQSILLTTSSVSLS